MEPPNQSAAANPAPAQGLALSVVIPVYNEEQNIEPVVGEAARLLESQFPGAWELIMVDDGSSDGTARVLTRLKRDMPALRIIHLRKNSGQSAALLAGLLAARGHLIATLDGDGQNDPADLPLLMREREIRQVDMMCGIRQKRRDNFIRRVSSRVANGIRSRVLKDRITDVGCSIRVFRREVLERMPFFRNMHRFFPALVIMQGFKVAEMPVNHRPRYKGVSKYGGGIRSRLFVGITDLLGVWWLRKRALRYSVWEE